MNNQGKCGFLRRSHKCRAFTVVELLVATAIIGVLVSLAIPAIGRARQSANRIQCVNNLRNIALALQMFESGQGHFPASGYYYDPPTGAGGEHHSWAVAILPYLEQGNLHDRWDFDRLLRQSPNKELATATIPIYVCPADLSRNKEPSADQSYAVNGGWGYTTRTSSGVGDCPRSWHGPQLDLNSDGMTCTGNDQTDAGDREPFKQLGMFFLENWKVGGTERHHSMGSVDDGTSQTFLVTENVRTGFNPDDEDSSFASANPYLSAFYVGLPCRDGDCSSGSVDYSLSNAGSNRINGGRWAEEGTSPTPNSFHDGGVNMAYVDGHVSFLSETIDGSVYAALASPQGIHLDELLQQQVITGAGF